MKPELSVITPVLNAGRFMEFCILNVIQQNCLEAEHIIVDGGSQDGTLEIIQRYAAEYPHIRWVSEPDKGQSDAMNRGIAMARGEIIGILNADDYYELGVLCRIAGIFKSLPEPSLLVANCNVLDDNGAVAWVNKPSNLKFLDLLTRIYSFPINPSAYFYHKSLHDRVGLYSVEEHFVMDIDFLIKAARSAAEVRYTDETWGNFRYIKGTKTFENMSMGYGNVPFEALLRKYRHELPTWQRWQVTSKYIAYRFFSYVVYSLIRDRLGSKLLTLKKFIIS